MATTNATTTIVPDIYILSPYGFGDRRYEETVTLFIAAGGRIMQDGAGVDDDAILESRMRVEVTWRQEHGSHHTKYLSITFLAFTNALEVATETRSSSLGSFVIYRNVDILRFAASRNEMVRFWKALSKAIITGAVGWDRVTPSTVLSSNNNNNNIDSLQWLLILAHSVSSGSCGSGFVSSNLFGRNVFSKRQPTKLLVHRLFTSIESLPESVDHSSSVAGVHGHTLFNGYNGIPRNVWNSILDLIRSPSGIRSLDISARSVWQPTNIRDLCEALASENSSITSLTLPDIDFRSDKDRSGLRLFKSLLPKLAKNDKITKLNELDFIKKNPCRKSPMGSHKHSVMARVRPYLQRNLASPHRTTIKNFYTKSMSDESIINLMIFYKDNINSTFQILQAKPELLSKAIPNEEDDNGG